MSSFSADKTTAGPANSGAAGGDEAGDSGAAVVAVLDAQAEKIESFNSDDDILNYMFNPGLEGRPTAADFLPDEQLGEMVPPSANAEAMQRVHELELSAIKVCEEVAKQEKAVDGKTDDDGDAKTGGDDQGASGKPQQQAPSDSALAQYERAIGMLTEAIKLCSNWASAYNNRAQVYSLMGKVEEALADLNKAVEFGGGRRTILKQAYTQRGMVHRFKGDLEAARRDFAKGAKLGSRLAKAHAVHLNPYAALCNQMMEQMISSYFQDDLHAEAPPKQ